MSYIASEVIIKQYYMRKSAGIVNELLSNVPDHINVTAIFYTTRNEYQLMAFTCVRFS